MEVEQRKGERRLGHFVNEGIEDEAVQEKSEYQNISENIEETC